jgi:hypothetical protein
MKPIIRYKTLFVLHDDKSRILMSHLLAGWKITTKHVLFTGSFFVKLKREVAYM